MYTKERDIVTRGYVVWHKILSVSNYLKCTYKYIVQIFYYLYNKQTGPGLLLFFPWILFQAVQVVSPTLGLPCWSSWSPYDFYSSSLFSTHIQYFIFTGDMLFILLLSHSPGLGTSTKPVAISPGLITLWSFCSDN